MINSFTHYLKQQLNSVTENVSKLRILIEEKNCKKMIDQYYLYSDDVKQEDLEDAVYAGIFECTQ